MKRNRSGGFRYKYVTRARSRHTISSSPIQALNLEHSAFSPGIITLSVSQLAATSSNQG